MIRFVGEVRTTEAIMAAKEIWGKEICRAVERGGAGAT